MTATLEQVKERPIIFSAPMIRAILDGSKTQTRRVVKPQPVLCDTTQTLRFAGKCHCDTYDGNLGACFSWLDDGSSWCSYCGHRHDCHLRICPYGNIGTLLWVRETWTTYRGYDERVARPDAEVIYRADVDHNGCVELLNGDEVFVRNAWKPSIYMPRWASRITLEITDVRVQRVQEISEVDAYLEGFCEDWLEGVPWQDAAELGNIRSGFKRLWESINGKKPGCSWAENPWVWALTFKRLP